MKKSLTGVFLVLMLGLVVAPAAALFAQVVPFSATQFLTTGTLFGQVMHAQAPDLSVTAIASGQAQAQFGPWLAERMGRPRERLIRISNLFDFWAGRSPNPAIMIGRNYELYTREQLEDWCLHANTDFTADLARRLVRARERLRTLGKPFVFLISPNKAALSPAKIPGYCRPPATPRAIDRLVAQLPRSDFPVVNAEAILEDKQHVGPWPAFGQYGQHWNDVGQFYTTRAVWEELQGQLGRKLGHLELAQVRVDDRPTGDDADTGLLLNLPIELRPKSPHASLAVEDRGDPINIIFVGTSFAGGPIGILLRERLVSHITLYNYFHFAFEYTRADIPGVALDQPVATLFPAALPQADAIILEANAPALNSAHLAAFLDAVEALP